MKMDAVYLSESFT